MASTTFSGPVTSNNGFVGDVVGAVRYPTFTVATVPDAAAAGAGTTIYVSNGLAGAPTLAVSDGTDWISSAGTEIAAA